MNRCTSILHNRQPCTKYTNYMVQMTVIDVIIPTKLPTDHSMAISMDAWYRPMIIDDEL